LVFFLTIFLKLVVDIDQKTCLIFKNVA